MTNDELKQALNDEYRIEITFKKGKDLIKGYKVILYDKDEAAEVYEKIRAAGDLK